MSWIHSFAGKLEMKIFLFDNMLVCLCPLLCLFDCLCLPVFVVGKLFGVVGSVVLVCWSEGTRKTQTS